MEHNEPDRVMAFDTLFTTNHIRMLKVVMPFFAPSMQQRLAVYIKYMELQYTLSYFRKYQFPPFSGSFDTHNLFGDILPYCSPEDKEKIKQVESMFSAMENYRNMMEMMSMMKELFPEGAMSGSTQDGTSGSPFGGFSPDMLSGLFGSQGSPDGNSENGGMDMAGLMNLFQMLQK